MYIDTTLYIYSPRRLKDGFGIGFNLNPKPHKLSI